MITDALALVAVSQLICIGAIGYLALQVHSLQKSQRSLQVTTSVQRPIEGRASEARPAEIRRRNAASAYAPAAATPGAAAAAAGGRPSVSAQIHDTRQIVEKMTELGMDVPALARRIGRSEEEIRLMLRRDARGARGGSI